MHPQIFSFSPASSLPQRRPSVSLSFCLGCPARASLWYSCAAWLRCKRDCCKALGHFHLLLCFLFTSCTFLSASSALVIPLYCFFWAEFWLHLNIYVIHKITIICLTAKYIMTCSQVSLSRFKYGRKVGRRLRQCFSFSLTHFLHSEVLYSTAYFILNHTYACSVVSFSRGNSKARHLSGYENVLPSLPAVTSGGV